MNRLLYKRNIHWPKIDWYKFKKVNKLEKLERLDKWIKNKPVINIESVVKNKQ